MSEYPVYFKDGKSFVNQAVVVKQDQQRRQLLEVLSSVVRLLDSTFLVPTPTGPISVGFHSSPELQNLKIQLSILEADLNPIVGSEQSSVPSGKIIESPFIEGIMEIE